MRRKTLKPAVILWQFSIVICLGGFLQACDSSTTPPVTIAPIRISASSSPAFPIKTTSPFPQSPVPPTTTVDLSGPTWQTRWLQKIPCAAPCWEGITPGITTAKETLDILRSKKNISYAQINWSSINEVGWEWVGGSQTGGDYHDGGGRALFDGNDGKPIYLIVPDLERPIFFGDIIRIYGEPSHILAGFNRNIHGGTTYFYYLVYLTLGFELFHSETHKFDISSSSFYFDSIDFFANNFEGFKKVSSSENDYKYIVPWQGFKTFDFYCQTREKNNPEKCSDA